MKIRTMLGLATIGGLLYMHRKHGGDWTIDSFRESGRDLLRGIQAGAERAKDEARRGMQEARDQIGRAAQDVSRDVRDELNQEPGQTIRGNGQVPR